MTDRSPTPPSHGPGDAAFGSSYPAGPGGVVPPPGFPGQNLPGFGHHLPYGDVPAKRTTNGFAITSFVIGLLSLFMCGFGAITGVAGVVFGIIGIHQVSADPERVGGKGLAIAGIVVSIIAVVFSVVLVSRTWHFEYSTR